MKEEHEIVLTTGGAGFSRDAMSRSKSNRSALRSNKSNNPIPYDIKRTEAIKKSELSGEELSKVVSKIQSNLKSRRRKQLIFFGVIATIVTIVSIVFLS